MDNVEPGRDFKRIYLQARDLGTISTEVLMESYTDVDLHKSQSQACPRTHLRTYTVESTVQRE